MTFGCLDPEPIGNSGKAWTGVDRREVHLRHTLPPKSNQAPGTAVLNIVVGRVFWPFSGFAPTARPTVRQGTAGHAG
jgi:hypothetical protein